MSDWGPLLPMDEDAPRPVIRWWIALACLAIDPAFAAAVLAAGLWLCWQSRPQPPRGHRS